MEPDARSVAAALCRARALALALRFENGIHELEPLLTASVASDWESRVNLAEGLGLGSAMLYSDRKGKPFRGHLLPVYGSFEAGTLFRVAEDLGLREGVSFVPPVDNLYVLTAQLALRAKL